MIKLFFRGLYAGMKRFGAGIASIVNFVLLIPVYLIGIGISAVIAKLSGKHFLDLKRPDRKRKTYWVEKEHHSQEKEEFYRQF